MTVKRRQTGKVRKPHPSDGKEFTTKVTLTPAQQDALEDLPRAEFDADVDAEQRRIEIREEARARHEAAKQRPIDLPGHWMDSDRRAGRSARGDITYTVDALHVSGGNTVVVAEVQGPASDVRRQPRPGAHRRRALPRCLRGRAFPQGRVCVPELRAQRPRSSRCGCATSASTTRDQSRSYRPSRAAPFVLGSRPFAGVLASYAPRGDGRASARLRPGRESVARPRRQRERQHPKSVAFTGRGGRVQDCGWPCGMHWVAPPHRAEGARARRGARTTGATALEDWGDGCRVVPPTKERDGTHACFPSPGVATLRFQATALDVRPERLVGCPGFTGQTPNPPHSVEHAGDTPQGPGRGSASIREVGWAVPGPDRRGGATDDSRESRKERTRCPS